jgi:hypothetical protein
MKHTEKLTFISSDRFNKTGTFLHVSFLSHGNA